jgi:hypothetical protein
MNANSSIFVFTVDSITSWILQNGIEIVVFLVGLLMGVLFVIAWRGSARDISLKNDARVRAILYGLGGFFTALIADWKGLLGHDVNKTQLLVLYSLPFASLGVLGPLCIAAVIWFRLSQVKRKRPAEFPGQPFYLALDYFIYGYRYHRDEYDRMVESAYERKRELDADIASNLAALILSSDSVRDVLRNMCVVFKVHTSASESPEVNSNLMIAIAYAEATAEQKNRLKFKFGDESRYGYLLWLTDYAYEKGEERISLAVEDPIRSQWEDTVLPGAPLAFLRTREVVVNTKRLDFAIKIPKNVQREMTQYFRAKGLKNFLSVPVIGNKKLIGIVNIEFSNELAAGLQNEVVKTLQPFCAVLTQILLSGVRK